MRLMGLEVSMFLSRVEIDRNNRRKTKELSHLGAYHSWVEDSFPNEKKSNVRFRKLWRIDPLGDKEYLLVVSPEQPDMELLEKYGVTNSAETKDYDHFLNHLEKNKRYRFRLVANPVVSIKRDPKSKKRGRVVPHVTVEQQRNYLIERSEKNGFHLSNDEFTIVERKFEPLNKKGHKTIRLSKVSYEGVLTITDVLKFKHLLINGLGRKKAYGFGMMTVIPGENV